MTSSTPTPSPQPQVPRTTLEEAFRDLAESGFGELDDAVFDEPQPEPAQQPKEGRDRHDPFPLGW